MTELFDRIVDKNLLIRRMYVVANRVLPEADAPKKRDDAVQLDFFTDYAAEAEKQKAEDEALARERRIQKRAFQGDEPRRRRDGQRPKRADRRAQGVKQTALKSKNPV